MAYRGGINVFFMSPESPLTHTLAQTTSIIVALGRTRASEKKVEIVQFFEIDLLGIMIYI